MLEWEKHADEELLALSVREPEAFGAFYRRHVNRVTGFVRTRAPADIAADVVAEVFAVALRDRHRFDPDRGTAPGWLIGIASHKLTDAKRTGRVQRRAQQRLGMQAIEWSEEDLGQIEMLASENRAQDWLRSLPEDQRDAVRSRVLDERDYGQIARQTGVSEATARKRVSRGLAALRRRVERKESQ